jgi:hypothetical protein
MKKTADIHERSCPLSPPPSCPDRNHREPLGTRQTDLASDRRRLSQRLVFRLLAGLSSLLRDGGGRASGCQNTRGVQPTGRALAGNHQALLQRHLLPLQPRHTAADHAAKPPRRPRRHADPVAGRPEALGGRGQRARRSGSRVIRPLPPQLRRRKRPEPVRKRPYHHSFNHGVLGSSPSALTK